MLFFLSNINKKFLENLYFTQSKRMWFIAIDILKNKQKAEDAVQSAFLKLTEKVPLLRSFCDEDKVSAYVYVVIKNQALELLRNDKKHTNINYDNLEYIIPSIDDTEKSAILNEEIETVKKEISKLEPIYKEVIYLRIFLGLEYKQIAEILKITNENARFRVFYGLKKLKTAITKNRGGYDE